MKWFKPAQQINSPDPGLYHYRREEGNEKSRIHLRLDPDGHGTLIVNANRILHLNPTAALMAYFILEQTPEPDAVRLIRKKYHVNAAQAQMDRFAANSRNLSAPTARARSMIWTWTQSHLSRHGPPPRIVSISH
jgi:hypothetical protein